jgi:hypothetical protein
VSTYANCFVGFGAIPADTTDSIKTPGVITTENGAKTVFQSPDLGHLIQYGTDITTPCDNRLVGNDDPTNFSLDFSFVYQSIYLLFDEDTAGLLKVMGFFNIDRIPAPKINDYHNNQGLFVEGVRGYGIALEADTVYTQFPVYVDGEIAPVQPTFNANTMRFASDNTTFYKVRPMTGLNAGAIVAPTFTVPVGFDGYFYGTQLPSTSVVMYVLYQADVSGSNYTFLAPGMYITGTGVGIPSPYITNFIGTNNIAVETYPSPSNAVFISDLNWNANNQYGITIGSPLALDNEVYIFTTNVLQAFFGYYVLSINPGTGPDGITTGQLLTLNNLVPAFFASQSIVMMTSVYTLNNPQNVDNIIGDYTNWVATLVSLNDRTGLLVPNLLTNLEGLSEIHVHCAQFRTQYMSSINFQALAPSDVIAVVPVDSTFGSAQTYNPPVTLPAYLTNTNIVTLNFQLTNPAGQLLDFNGLDWSMVLKCEEVEILSDVEQNTSGTLNTVYQDQLQAMESTGQSQIRMQRHKGKRFLPYQFFDNNESHRKKNNTFESQM